MLSKIIITLLLLSGVAFGQGTTGSMQAKKVDVSDVDTSNYIYIGGQRYYNSSNIRGYGNTKESLPLLSTGGGSGTVVRKFAVDPGIDHWQEEPKDEVFTPQGHQIQKNDRGQRNPFRVDTVIQMDDGIAKIKLNRKDIRFKITSPSSGSDPVILVTGKGTDTTSFTYRGAVVALKDNEYIQITSSDILDTSWVYVTMLMK